MAVDPHKAKPAQAEPAAAWSVFEKASRTTALPTPSQLVRSPMATGSVIRGGLFDQFLRFYFPNKSHCLDLSSYRWVSTITENRSDFLLVETTTCALGSLMISRTNEDKALERESLQLYGSALGHTRELWEQMNRKNWFRPLLGVSMLLLFEVCSSCIDSMQRALANEDGSHYIHPPSPKHFIMASESPRS